MYCNVIDVIHVLPPYNTFYDDVFSINKIYVLHIGNLQTCYIHSMKKSS